MKSIDDSKSPKQIDVELGDNVDGLVVQSTNSINGALEIKKNSSNKIEWLEIDKNTPTTGAGLSIQVLSLPNPSQAEVKGIYDLRGDKLVYCFAQPGVERPTSFKVTPGSKRTLIRLERFSTGEQKIEQYITKAGSHFRKDEIGWITNLMVHQTPDLDLDSMLK